MGGTLDRLDKNALVAFLINGTDVAAVDFEVRQAQVRQVADHAETPAETLQAKAVSQAAHASGETLQLVLLRHLLFADLQRQARTECWVLRQSLEHPLQGLWVIQGRRREVERHRLVVLCQVFDHQVEHQLVKACGPAEALQPGQEVPRRNGLVLVVEQARQYLVVQHLTGIAATDHRLEKQAEAPLIQGLVEQGVPVMRIVADGALGLALQAYPGLAATGFSLGQGLVGLHQQVCRGIAGVVGREADVGHVLHVCGACFVQAVQGGFQRLGQLHRFVTHQARGEHREFAAAAAGDQVLGFRVLGAGPHQLLADGLQQLVGALPAQALVEAGEVVDPQDQQVA